MIYFTSYGDSKYQISKERIYNEAKNMGFDNIKIFSPNDLSKEFIEYTNPYIKNHRGGGYWLWKSFIFKETFKLMKDDDIFIYADAGCHINLNGKKKII